MSKTLIVLLLALIALSLSVRLRRSSTKRAQLNSLNNLLNLSESEEPEKESNQNSDDKDEQKRILHERYKKGLERHKRNWERIKAEKSKQNPKNAGAMPNMLERKFYLDEFDY